jgi:hypothetical protein
MTAADVERRMGAVDAGLQWAWAASQQVRRLRYHERALLCDGDEQPSGRSRFLALRSDAELCMLALSNLAQVLDELTPATRRWPAGEAPVDLVEAVATLRTAIPTGRPLRRRDVVRRAAGVIDLRDDPRRCTFGPEGTRVAGLGLDELAGLLEPVLTFFSTLEASGFAWDGWRAVDR